MTLEDGCSSLKLECALRGLGFVEVGWRVIAHAGLFFVEPISWSSDCNPLDDLIGFQILEHVVLERVKTGLYLGTPLAQTAKQALDISLSLSDEH